MDIKKNFKTDEKKENEGTWVPIGDGAKLLVARFQNPNFNKVFDRLRKPHRSLIRSGNIPEELATDIMCRTMSKTILLGWEGLQIDGADYPYSEANALKLLKEYKDFREFVYELSRDAATFKEEEDREAEKN